MGKIAIICPTFGRKEQALNIYNSWFSTSVSALKGGLFSRFFYVVEESEEDWWRHTCKAMNEREMLVGLIVCPEGERGMARPLNYASQILKDWDYQLFVGDDHKFNTQNWDEKFIQAFEQGADFVYCPEGYHNENLATACAWKTDISNALGFACLPAFRHLMIDVYWMALGKQLNMVYLPEVSIEHLHPNFGKAKMDENYAVVNSNEIASHDQKVFQEWIESEGDKTFAQIIKQYRTKKK
jgi:hypothetical protein